ncbi:MAG: arsenate reductase (glutaredoxin) [Candidatus Latescibacteria bacterium]|nr:arsenate reductase (glutaredoxin) [Candidatus Latescibacterota bacterium]
MSEVVIYHNPRCSKSRQTLNLLRDRGIEPRIVEYLKTPPDEQTLSGILQMLGIRPVDLVRTKEDEFGALGLHEKRDDPRALIRAMTSHPILIERPIVINGNRARLGRPPENVLEIL